MDLASLIQAPRLWPASPHKHRRVTWMELFFDLIFVAAVAEVGSPLNAGYDLPGLLRYSFLFLLIWWAWSGHTLYSTRFDTDDLVQRVLILVQCFIAAVMAANAGEALESRSSAGFGAAYAGMRVVLVLQYLRARRIPETRVLTTRYALGFGAAAILWIVSAFLEAPERYWLWGAALLVDFATPWLAVRHSVETPPDPAHFPERFGLFTIILLGEFVAAVMRGIGSQEYWTFRAASTAFAAMTFAFVLRWWYFDCARAAEERHIRGRRQAVWFQIWHYSHLPLFLGIGVAGVGFEHTIALEAEGELHRPEAWILCGAVAVVMCALATLGAASEASHGRRRLARMLTPQYLLAGLVAGLGAAAGRLHPGLLAGLLAAAGCVQALLTLRATGAEARTLPKGQGMDSISAPAG